MECGTAALGCVQILSPDHGSVAAHVDTRYLALMYHGRLASFMRKPLSEVCQKYGIAPTQFYQWQKMFFENGASAFEPKKASKEYEMENKVKQLEKKLLKKDEVIGELVEHNISLKKVLARNKRCVGTA